MSDRTIPVLPDLTDEATLALLPTIAREAWGDPEAHARLDLDSAETRWVFWTREKWRVPGPHPEGSSESECYYAAILAAPGKVAT